MPEQTEEVHVGICLDPGICQISSCNGTRASDSGAVRISSATVPPAVLLPRIHSEPLRVDEAHPCHVRGTGGMWPPEARISRSGGAGRMPLAYAWPLLSENKEWHWREGGQAVTPSVAIGQCCASLHKAAVSATPVRPVVLVIPNDTSLAAQQNLIDAAMTCGGRATLLWRPVAAAMAWCEHYHKILEKTPRSGSGSIGSIVSLYVGLDRLEVAGLEVVTRPHQGTTHFIPARPRNVFPPFPSFGAPLFINLAADQLREAYGEAEPDDVWNLLWCTPWLMETVSTLAEGTAGSLRESWQRIYRVAGEAKKSGDLDWLFFGAFQRFTYREYLDWLTNVVSRLGANGSCQGAVISGPLAAVLYEGVPLGQLILSQLKMMPELLLLEGRDFPLGILPKMAALYSARKAAGLPTYLDTLPHLRTLVMNMGDPEWADLLQEEDEYVEGGQEWKRDPRFGIGKLSIGANRRCLEIDLNHEDYRTVRSVSADLAEPTATRVPISLAVSIVPAQGNARMEVVPDKKGALGEKRVLVNWKTMKDTGKTPEKWLAEQLRVCPPVTKRQQSIEQWRHVRCEIEAFLRVHGRRVGSEEACGILKNIGSLLQQSDPYRKNHYAIGSDGTVPNGESVLNEFDECLVSAVCGQTRIPRANREIIFRILGHSYSPHPVFQQFLCTSIGRERLGLEDWQLLPIGRCLRDSSAIGQFARILLRKLTTESLFCATI